MTTGSSGTPPAGVERTALAELVAIGDELLLGDNVDTNSAHVARRLAELGVRVVRHTAVGDGIEAMATALREALDRADVVLTTGGLGPTQDDRTRVAVARVAGVDLVRDEAVVGDIAASFASRGRSMPPSNRQQADLPAGGWWLTRVGSAPGFAVEIGGRVVFSMPGVPHEMEAMLDADVLPWLAARFDAATTVSRVVRTSGRSESGIADALAPLVARVEPDGRVAVAFLASGGETRVKVTATAADRHTALELVDPVVDEVVERIGRGVVGLDEEGVEHLIGRLLTERGETVAVAESITGGGVGARLVTVPGASAWFRGGLITYATETKSLLAGLDPPGLQGGGPVSEWAARELAVAAHRRLGADHGLGVVGVAGPDPVGETGVGTVWVAVAGSDGALRTHRASLGDRGRIGVQRFAASAALSLLSQTLLGE